jgi:hypothetical protein
VALVAVIVANAAASVLRFAILRAWVFRPDPPAPAEITGDAFAGEAFTGDAITGEGA